MIDAGYGPMPILLNMTYPQFLHLSVAAAKRMKRRSGDLFGLVFVATRGNADSVKKQFAAYHEKK